MATFLDALPVFSTQDRDELLDEALLALENTNPDLAQFGPNSPAFHIMGSLVFLIHFYLLKLNDLPIQTVLALLRLANTPVDVGTFATGNLEITVGASLRPYTLNNPVFTGGNGVDYVLASESGVQTLTAANTTVGIVATVPGTIGNLEANKITGFLNQPSQITVTQPSAIVGGAPPLTEDEQIELALTKIKQRNVLFTVSDYDTAVRDSLGSLSAVIVDNPAPSEVVLYCAVDKNTAASSTAKTNLLTELNLVKPLGVGITIEDLGFQPIDITVVASINRDVNMTSLLNGVADRIGTILDYKTYQYTDIKRNRIISDLSRQFPSQFNLIEAVLINGSDDDIVLTPYTRPDITFVRASWVQSGIPFIQSVIL